MSPVAVGGDKPPNLSARKAVALCDDRRQVFGVELAGLHGNPYLGILAYLILPAIFVLGLVLLRGVDEEEGVRVANRAEW